MTEDSNAMQSSNNSTGGAGVSRVGDREREREPLILCEPELDLFLSQPFSVVSCRTALGSGDSLQGFLSVSGRISVGQYNNALWAEHIPSLQQRYFENVS